MYENLRINPAANQQQKTIRKIKINILVNYYHMICTLRRLGLHATVPFAMANIAQALLRRTVQAHLRKIRDKNKKFQNFLIFCTVFTARCTIAPNLSTKCCNYLCYIKINNERCRSLKLL